MIDSLDGMVVMASDQQKAIEFYTQKLGFELRSDTPFSSGTIEDILWVGSCTEVIQSTNSLMVPNTMMTSDGVEMNLSRKVLEQKLGIGFTQ
jgi:catechol 2,3-dioxygenase-like lactoylglutathione lyase family enzyme